MRIIKKLGLVSLIHSQKSEKKITKKLGFVEDLLISWIYFIEKLVKASIFLKNENVMFLHNQKLRKKNKKLGSVEDLLISWICFMEKLVKESIVYFLKDGECQKFR